ncbi:hypothetical protein KY308_00340 [Candidatus Woesearchaeota archaeon]|nr:hypothetical protein [Candidatus Woesearchaeota archaeon]
MKSKEYVSVVKGVLAVALGTAICEGPGCNFAPPILNGYSITAKTTEAERAYTPNTNLEKVLAETHRL